MYNITFIYQYSLLDIHVLPCSRPVETPPLISYVLLVVSDYRTDNVSFLRDPRIWLYELLFNPLSPGLLGPVFVTRKAPYTYNLSNSKATTVRRPSRPKDEPVHDRLAPDYVWLPWLQLADSHCTSRNSVMVDTKNHSWMVVYGLIAS